MLIPFASQTPFSQFVIGGIRLRDGEGRSSAASLRTVSLHKDVYCSYKSYILRFGKYEKIDHDKYLAMLQFNP